MLNQTQRYQVAAHFFSIHATEELWKLLPNYAPFRTDQTEGTDVFTIHVLGADLPTEKGWNHIYTDTSDDDMPRIEMYEKEGSFLFRISMNREGEIVSAIQCSADWKEVKLYTRPEYIRFAVDNAAMLVYAFSTASMKTLLFHSSVTVRDGKGYMFLGHSGTGKSTHSRQWLTAFADAELLNDDNPAVRILPDQTVRVYGTPWSGKTPCYKNNWAEVGALVQLEQAPENRIQRLRMTQAYPYILASVSGLKIIPAMMDELYESIAELLERCPVYKLECLPNVEAAQLCAQTCSL